ncbi:hypothetical protein Mgra_00003050 [Meloidogyne graminicola]|uniref:Uncharacterized protein n=1 Tax=Meloidogyne graminicola TaxID=189291 RepID=A0A8S9ZWU2_9BILA|nr:hypothetical protein Mgra_00003050 [Meloidogyne graminicola]
MLSIRSCFHNYYEYRRRFRSWKRRIIYYPNQTFKDIAKKGLFLKFCAQFLTWNVVIYFLIKSYYREEWDLLNKKGIENPKFSQLRNERSEKIDKQLYTYLSPLHRFLDVQTPKRNPIDLTKTKYPLDDL